MKSEGLNGLQGKRPWGSFLSDVLKGNTKRASIWSPNCRLIQVIDDSREWTRQTPSPLTESQGESNRKKKASVWTWTSGSLPPNLELAAYLKCPSLLSYLLKPCLAFRTRANTLPCRHAGVPQTEPISSSCFPLVPPLSVCFILPVV